MDNFFKLRPFRRHLYLESYPQMLWLAPHAGQQKWESVSNSAMLNRSASQTLPIHSASGRHQCKSSQLCSWVTWRIMHTSSSSQHSVVTVVKVVMVMPLGKAALCFSFFFCSGCLGLLLPPTESRQEAHTPIARRGRSFYLTEGCRSHLNHRLERATTDTFVPRIWGVAFIPDKTPRSSGGLT